MIIVTGAVGFIGSVLAWDLNRRGYKDLILVDHIDPQGRPLLLKKTSYKKFLFAHELPQFLLSPEAREVQGVFHMGANSSTLETNREHLVENNLEYSQRLFQWCARQAIPYIYASSAATYGKGELLYDDHLDSEQLQPMNLYGWSKVMMDRWVFRQAEAPPSWYGVKFFNVYGPNELYKGPMASVVFKSFFQIQKDKKISLFKSYHPDFSNGEQKRDFIYVKDVSQMMIDLFERKPASGIYNMGSGQATTWNNLAQAIFSALDLKANIEYIEMPESIRSQYQYYSCADMRKWKESGLPSPQFDLSAGVSDYVRNYLQRNEVYG